MKFNCNGFKLLFACYTLALHVLTFSQNTSFKSAEKVFYKDIVNGLLEKSIQFSPNDINQSLFFATRALKTSLIVKDFHKIGACAEQLAEVYRLMGEQQKSLYFANIALIYFHVIKDADKIDHAISTLANTYWAKSDFSKALHFSYLLLRSAEKTSDTLKIIIANTSIANINYARGEFQEAYHNLENALTFANQFSESTTQIQFTLNQNIANVLMDLGDLDKAIKHIDFVCAIADTSDNQNMKYIAQTQRGYLLYEKNDFENAIIQFSEALKISQEIGITNNIASGFMEIGRSYYNWAKQSESIDQRTTLFRSAIIQLQQASKLYLAIENLNEFKYCQELLSECYENIDDYKNAFNAIKSFNHYEDSLFNSEKNEEITSLKMKYAFAKEQDSIQLINDREILLRDVKIEERERLNLLLFIVLIVIFGLGLVLYKQNRIIRQKNEELNKSNLIKLRLFGIINHDMRSPIANLLQSLYIQKENPSFAEMLDKNIIAVENLYQAMDDLLLWSKSQMEQFEQPLNPVCVNKVIKSVVEIYPTEVIFEMNESHSEVYVNADENFLKVILRNLISNALESLRKRDNPKITISIIQTEGDTRLIVSDNGQGAKMSEFDSLFNSGTSLKTRGGLGLQMVRDLTQILNCSIEVESKIDFGTTIMLIFKG